MRRNAPKKLTWWISLILAVVGVVAKFVAIPVLSAYAFWLVVLAFVLIWLGTFVKGL